MRSDLDRQVKNHILKGKQEFKPQKINAYEIFGNGIFIVVKRAKAINSNPFPFFQILAILFAKKFNET